MQGYKLCKAKTAIMKRISISLGCLLVGIMTLAQTIATTLEPPQIPQAYWQKANNQRTTAWILTAGGAAATHIQRRSR